MGHTISVTAEGRSAGALAEELAAVPGVQVVERARTDHLALDPASVSLIIAGIGTVNALISALATVWAARGKQSAAAPAAADPGHAVVHVHTDADEVRVIVSPSGTIVESSAPLPAAVEDITDIHLASVAAPG
jgi:hypothetical protein